MVNLCPSRASSCILSFNSIKSDIRTLVRIAYCHGVVCEVKVGDISYSVKCIQLNIAILPLLHACQLCCAVCKADIVFSSVSLCMSVCVSVCLSVWTKT